jgi:2-dehydropantoate 2-reductase
MKTSKILVAGIGGVGGYFGGLLAKEFEGKAEADIYFLSRGQSLQEIKANGLKVVDNGKEFIARPSIASDNVAEFGPVDYLLLCTKTYSLAALLQQLSTCIQESTIIIPLQNGIGSQQLIANTYPRNLVTHGCAFVVSSLKKPGLIVKKGPKSALSFGLDKQENDQLAYLDKLLKQAGIHSKYSSEITQISWEKFIFLSSIATATSYFDVNIEQVLSDKHKVKILEELIEEVTALARAKNISLTDNQKKRVFDLLKATPKGATTSMHRDFIAQKEHTELESLTGYVVREGKMLKLNVGTFESLYLKLKQI